MRLPSAQMSLVLAQLLAKLTTGLSSAPGYSRRPNLFFGASAALACLEKCLLYQLQSLLANIVIAIALYLSLITYHGKPTTTQPFPRNPHVQSPYVRRAGDQGCQSVSFRHCWTQINPASGSIYRRGPSTQVRVRQLERANLLSHRQ